MISDTTQRYLLAKVGDKLWRYDARFRTYKFIPVADGAPFDVIEGNIALAVVVHDEEQDQIVVTVRAPKEPENALATGVFQDGKWSFIGDKQAWELVPEYILIPRSDVHSDLLRIEDGAEIDDLEDVDNVHDVVHIPNSRLVLLVREGSWLVYDPMTKKSFGNHELAGKEPKPQIRFRNKDEMFVNDVDTMLKVESKHFKVLDAAGSDVAHDTEDKARAGSFGQWTFAAGGELVVIPRPYLGDVLVLDAVSLLPVARGVFRRGTPIDAMMIGRNTLVAVAPDGVPLRVRARRVKVPAETVQADLDARAGGEPGAAE